MTSPLPDPQVLFSTRRVAVICKPEGMLSVPGKGPEGHDCAAARVQKLFPHATGPLVVHRLDMDTSGILVFGLDPDAQRDLSRQFESRLTSKRYIALVEGLVPREEGVIDIPMRADLENRPHQIVDFELGRPAQTSFRVLAYETDRTRLEMIPLTGRTHQLRVHAAYPGPGGLAGSATDRPHPILGDVLYGDEHSAPRLMLHAAALTFTDPESGAPITVTSEAPF